MASRLPKCLLLQPSTEPRGYENPHNFCVAVTSLPSASLDPQPHIIAIHSLVFGEVAEKVYGLLRSLRNHGAAWSCKMAGAANGFADSSTYSTAKYTVTALNRWSVANKKLPGWKPSASSNVCFQANESTKSAASQIKAIHIYDFDNTCKFCGHRVTSRQTN